MPDSSVSAGGQGAPPPPAAAEVEVSPASSHQKESVLRTVHTPQEQCVKHIEGHPVKPAELLRQDLRRHPFQGTAFPLRRKRRSVSPFSRRHGSKQLGNSPPLGHSCHPASLVAFSRSGARSHRKRYSFSFIRSPFPKLSRNFSHRRHRLFSGPHPPAAFPVQHRALVQFSRTTPGE